MEKVKRQTVNELIAVAVERQKLIHNYFVNEYGRTCKIVEEVLKQKADTIIKIAKTLAEQCHNALKWFNIDELADIVCQHSSELENSEEVFCKILSVFGVEVEQ